LLNKPYGVLSQFTKEVDTHITLADYVQLEKDVYPVGRLDKDSEGLLLLTNDNNLKTKLLSPKSKKPKTYLAQVDGAISASAIVQLQEGVEISINKKKHLTLPAKVRSVSNINIPPRVPPVRFRAEIPTSWVEIIIHEGKNRQIRKMCSAVGFPVLRLIRIAICDLNINIPSGEYIQLSESQIKLLR